ncbi:hypothetical protein AMTR_s00006p00143870, partial [Amborella trichopoda]
MIASYKNPAASYNNPVIAFIVHFLISIMKLDLKALCYDDDLEKKGSNSTGRQRALRGLSGLTRFSDMCSSPPAPQHHASKPKKTWCLVPDIINNTINASDTIPPACASLKETPPLSLPYSLQ